MFYTWHHVCPPLPSHGHWETPWDLAGATLGLTAQPTSTALSKWNACDLVTPLGSPKTSLFRAANVTGNWPSDTKANVSKSEEIHSIEWAPCSIHLYSLMPQIPGIRTSQRNAVRDQRSTDLGSGNRRFSEFQASSHRKAESQVSQWIGTAGANILLVSFPSFSYSKLSKHSKNYPKSYAQLWPIASSATSATLRHRHSVDWERSNLESKGQLGLAQKPALPWRFIFGKIIYNIGFICCHVWLPEGYLSSSSVGWYHWYPYIHGISWVSNICVIDTGCLSSVGLLII